MNLADAHSKAAGSRRSAKLLVLAIKVVYRHSARLRDSGIRLLPITSLASSRTSYIFGYPGAALTLGKSAI